MKTPYRRIRFFVPIFILLALLAVSYAVYWLWNTVLIAVVPVKSVTFWQAVGLLILSRILFGGFKFGSAGGRFRGGEGSPPWRERWRQMSDDDRSKFKREWRKRCNDKPEL
ncbi:hypothetical protein [Spirosoma fluviale]|uniref:Uncharacterized protein n=1 Tax=Spirosoma fluviale TaxID=1597977 RepID=A0A286FA97_9BACT|nr:hypothetical protein [Spirosoma fluviale]SOD80168.1 hypothetical protein SAMN06269250_1267 [Spirosoma fluviale]